MPATAPYDPSVARVRLSATLAGTYTNIAKVRSFNHEEGSEGDTVIRWLGGDALRPGDATLGGTLPVWWDRSDTTGQDLMRAAKRAGTTVFLQICPAGTATGEKADQFEALITGVTVEADSTSNEGVPGSFTYKGLPSTLTTITLA
jgi:hypothetical protein